MFTKIAVNAERKYSHYFYLLFFSTFILLTACSSSSTTEDGSTVTASDGTTFSLKIVDENNDIIRNIDRNLSATVIATVKSSNGSSLSGLIVSFATDLGSIDPETGTALTLADGTARVTLTAGDVAGASKVDASVTISGGETLDVSFGFSVGGTTVDPDPTPDPDPDPEPDPGAVSNSVIGAIEFVSASPSVISLRSTGGAGLSEFSTITFRLVGSDGLPMTGRTVNFSLTTDVGGIDIDPRSAVTNTAGLVSTIVQSGSIPTTIRIEAKTTLQDEDGNDEEIFTQSDLLAVSTGIPDQNSMSLSLSTFNPETYDYDGIEVDVTARLADHFNNFVPDGTMVYFTTEGGAIGPSCSTVDGGCSVKWISQNPRPSDHRVTILATTLGNESFQDTDSNGIYTTADGEPFEDSNGNEIYDEPFTDSNGNGVFDEPFVATVGNGVYDLGETFTDAPNGIYDQGEAFVDALNGVYDGNESFTDQNNNSVYDFGEPFVDALNGFWNPGETFTDVPNGIYDPGEDFVDAPDTKYDMFDFFVDYNENGIHDGDKNDPNGETIFIDSIGGNGLYNGAGMIPAGETFTDLNGNKDTTTNAGFEGPGFADLPEPFLDANENGVRDIGEIYIDTNNDGAYSARDEQYNGILCEPGNNCSDNAMIHIRRSTTLIMSGSSAKMLAIQNGTNNIYAVRAMDGFARNTNYIDARFGGSDSIRVYIADSAGQAMPSGSSIKVSSNVGDLGGQTDTTMVDTNAPSYLDIRGSNSELAYEGWYSIVFSVTDNDPEKAESGTVSITITTPKGLQSTIIIPVLV